MRLVIVLFGLCFIAIEDPNFRPLAEAKCHTVWKMIVGVSCALSIELDYLYTLNFQQIVENEEFQATHYKEINYGDIPMYHAYAQVS